MRTANAVVTIAGAATGDASASFNSDPFPVSHMTWAAICATISGSASLNSTLKIQACVDPAQNPGTGATNISGLTNWVDVASTSATVTSDGSTMWNIADIGWSWLRVVYTRTTGTGAIAIRANAKGND